MKILHIFSSKQRPSTKYMQSASAMCGFLILSGPIGCAKMEISSINLIAPSGIIASGCSGVPVAYSRIHERVAFSCGDGSLRISSLGGRHVTSVKDAHVLQASSLRETDQSAWFYAFRSAVDDSPASLVRYDLVTGSRDYISLGSSGIVDSISQLEIDPVSRCLLVSSGYIYEGQEVHAFLAYELTSDSNIERALSGEPQIKVIVSPNEASGIGNPNLGFTRCIRDERGNLKLLVTRIRPVPGDAAEYSLEVHSALSESYIIHRSSELWRIPWRTSESKAVLIEASGQLRLIEVLSNGAHVRNLESNIKWIDYDLGEDLGVGVMNVDGRNELIKATCIISSNSFTCDVESIDTDVESAYSVAVGAQSSGSVISYDSVGALPNRKNVLSYRWLF